ncbi:MAG: MMPL family transporter [Oxalicibacterium faecigallinarum]|uniref:MMPL family transporter n=1 Tax=Oxalicibacterium faecigallinarum TaxID=573741 RepID=UPI00280673DF|nr:MMPL family transporter [Oxalicibacterium faecigallinarum]MDQ7968529.1 MMPL family transporter [Oxalicibacterium faecigallinarum]
MTTSAQHHAAPPRSWKAIGIWLILLLIGVGILFRSTFTADLTAFLPNNPTQEQKLLVEQLRDGMVSRMILIGIDGADTPTHAALSKALAQKMRSNDEFVSVNNGEPVNQEKDRAYLFNNRYLLSPGVTPERFSVEGLHEAFSETVDLLASPAGMLVKDILPQDPTAEMATLITQFNSGQQPRKVQGVWVAKDGGRALILAQTRALGSDTDGQEMAITHIREKFEAAKADVAKTLPQAAKATMIMTGPGVFGVNARNTISKEAGLFAIISAVLIMTILLIVYRSGVAVLLGLAPVLSGVLAGTIAVSLGFGSVHAITLGFGTTLIGEAIDYAIYLFIQSGSAKNSADWAKKSWPTIRLGVLTSMSGFGALLFSGFPGLAQLGLFTIAGLVSAAFVTRYVLPSLLPRDFVVRDLSHIGFALERAIIVLRRLRLVVLGLVVIACVVLWINRNDLWQPELGALSPVSQQDKDLDEKLRKDIGAPDVRYLVVVKGKTLEDALQASEKVAARLDGMVEHGHLAAFESPTRYLPSQAMQKARLASLPNAATLTQRVAQAIAGLPFQASVLAPFIASVDTLAQTATQPDKLESRLLSRKDLTGTSMALATDSLLIEQQDETTALLPLTANADDHLIDAALMRSELEKSGVKEAYFIDLKIETDKLYSGYMREAVLLALCGLAAMTVLLGFSIRSAGGLARVMVPLITAVLSVAAFFMLTGERMTILHLVGLLLIVAVGSNYALFFAQPPTTVVTDPETGAQEVVAQIKPTTLASLIFANLTTVIGFGVLGFSSVPILSAIGKTVGIGVILALVYSAVFSSMLHSKSSDSSRK